MFMFSHYSAHSGVKTKQDKNENKAKQINRS